MLEQLSKALEDRGSDNYRNIGIDLEKLKDPLLIDRLKNFYETVPWCVKNVWFDISILTYLDTMLRKFEFSRNGMKMFAALYEGVSRLKKDDGSGSDSENEVC